MPTRLKLTLSAVGVGSLLLIAMAVAAAARVTPALGVLVALVALGATAAILFVYEPRFDPTGHTLWRLRTRERVVALTFDDGPSPHTGPLLDRLAAHGVRVTFFFLGENARRHPDLVARARADGHAIGNHGLSHVKVHRLSAAELERELEGARPFLGPLAEVGGRPLVRLPHGFKSLRAVRRLTTLGYQLVAWTNGVWDTDRPGTDVIVTRLRRALRPGSVLLLHDGDGIRTDAERTQTVEATELFVAGALRDGWRFVTLPELFSGGSAPRSPEART